MPTWYRDNIVPQPCGSKVVFTHIFDFLQPKKYFNISACHFLAKDTNYLLSFPVNNLTITYSYSTIVLKNIYKIDTFSLHTIGFSLIIKDRKQVKKCAIFWANITSVLRFVNFLSVSKIFEKNRNFNFFVTQLFLSFVFEQKHI